MTTREQQKRKEARIHRNAMRSKVSRIRRFMSGIKIADRPNWK